MFEPSAHQFAVRQFVAEGEGNAVVNAVAGSGKTTTILWACTAIPKGQTCLFLCFNKSVAVELAKKAPAGVKTSTLNAIGYRFLQRNYGLAGPLVLDPKKTEALYRDHCAEHDQSEGARLNGAVARRLVRQIKALGLYGPTLTRAAMDAALDGLSGEVDAAQADRLTVKRMAFELVQRSLDTTSTFDFDDQLWVPVAKNLPGPTFDWIVVDEAQDLSPVQLMLVRRLLRPAGRLLAVGDERQAIYGFRGADPSSMRNLAEAFQASFLPLTTTYRCARRIVDAAQQVVPYIQAAPTAPAGRVRCMPVADVDARGRDTLVLCRYNAPLVKAAYRWAASGRTVRLAGAQELARKLQSTFDAFGIRRGVLAYRVAGILRDKLEEWTGEGRQLTAAYEALLDQWGSVEEFAQHDRHCVTAGCIIEAARRLAGDGPTDVALSTIHRAKGLEADRVILLYGDFALNSRADGWRREQEWNLLYVAITRAKIELIIETEHSIDDWYREIAAAVAE